MEALLKQIIKEFDVEENKIVEHTISKLIDNAQVCDLSKLITDTKQEIFKIFSMYREKEEFKERHITITNAHVKKEYEYIFDLQEFKNIGIKQVRNLSTIGLSFDVEQLKIYGVPTLAHSIDLQIIFYSKQDTNQSEDIKIVPFIVNADPKDLWRDVPSDRNMKFAKPDTDTFFDTFLDKKIIVASKRGRSHAHDGTFRDDDFAVKKLVDGWEIVAVADGAGSAKYAREGSKIASQFIVDSFNNQELLVELSNNIIDYFNPTDTEQLNAIAGTVENLEDVQPMIGQEQVENQILKVKSNVINILYKNVRNLHTMLVDFAKAESINLKDLNTTLIFALVKKFDFGYVSLTFGVGDCPINIINEDFDEVKLLNVLDIGEFGGGTRFITMPEIFSNANMALRFDINKFTDFSKMILMTDGIYDPKFVTENKLEDLDTWQSFIRDLEGENEDNIKVNFIEDENIQDQLLDWMDFWSKGNHDDRTLAIIY